MRNIQPTGGESFSELYFQAISNGNIQAVSELVTKHGVDVYSCDNKGRNLLHLAVQSKMFALVEFFFLRDENQVPFSINRERLLMASDNDGKNILHYAVLCDNYRFFADVLVKIMDKYDVYKDPHEVQIGDLYLRRDRNNRKAIDYAVMFKKQNMVNAQANHVLTHSTRMFYLQYESSPHDEEGTYQALKQNLVVQGVTMDNAEMTSDWCDMFNSIIARSCAMGYVKVVKFFLEEDTAQLVERVHKNKNPNKMFDRDVLVRWMASLSVEGNINDFINFLGSEALKKTEYLRRSPAMKLTFYDHIRRWNYSSTNKMGLMAYIHQNFDRLVRGDVYLEMYVRMLAERNAEQSSSANIDSRFKLLIYFASISLAMLPGIFPYFKHSQPQLFGLMMGRFPNVYSLLTTKVRDDAQMISVVTQNSNNEFFFMRDANNRIVYNDMTICECLLIYAATTDRVNELEFGLDYNKKYKIGALNNNQGFNSLQWTAIYGSYITLKCSFAKKIFQKKDILANNVNTIALTVANGHQHVAEYLVHKLGNKVSFRGDVALIANYYALTSSAVLTKVWHKSAAKIQALGRRYIARKKLRFRFGLSFAEWRQYNKVWGAVVQQLAVRSASAVPITWIDIKRQFDIVVVSSTDVEDASEYDHDLSASIDQITDKVVSSVSTVAELPVFVVTETHSAKVGQPTLELNAATEPDTTHHHTVPLVDNIELSADVVKWVNKTDSKYRAMFQSKLERLAGGDRSYALSKRLQHCDYPIYETKLDDGMRILWTVLRREFNNCIMGRPLTVEQYLDLSVFGMDRCRLSVEDRREVYAVFVRYEDVLTAQDLWDDADYTLHLLNRSKLQPLSTQYDKVYVDEVQDNTQAEIVLYFLAAGMNTQSLFLAGDPAQSVVEGVDFRFEDVRSIVYKLSGGKQSIHRPMKLAVNYRSHSGVLSCASSVLSGLFAAFPASANVLPKDTGLFHGPRPACCMVDGLSGLSELLLSNQRWSVLCLDDQAEAVQSALSEHEIVNIVLGIRAAKGLEFQDVVLLDFFGNIPAADHAVWKTIFTSTTTEAVESVAAQHPEVELQLKLLYTAITRSCNRLIFVETKPSTLASVMFRWFTSQNITEMYQRNSGESALLMTSDEWRVQGIEFALSAEGDSTAMFLEQAIKCFTQAKDAALLDRATAQLKVTQLWSKLQHRAVSVPKLTDGEETEVAAVLYNAIKCGFYNESKMVCQLVCDKVKQTALFKHEILMPLFC